MGFKAQLAKAEKGDWSIKKTPPVFKKKKAKVKTKPITSSPSYTQGCRDGEKLAETYSLWMCYAMVRMMGFCRKTSQSNKKLFRYCDGINDALDGAALAKGVEVVDGNYPQEEIGR